MPYGLRDFGGVWRHMRRAVNGNSYYPTYVAYGAATVAMFVYVTDIEAIVKYIPVYRKYKGLPKEG